MRFSSKSLEEAVFFEIGAGHDLAVPIALRRMGAKKVVASDVNRLAKLDLVDAAAQIISINLEKSFPAIRNWSELKDFGVSYIAPHNTAKEETPVVDAFISNEVLEHIPLAVLGRVNKNLSSNLAPGGLSLHSIDYNDHYARDGGVSRYNFLQFSDEDWKPFNANMHYVNRLRHSEYIKLMADAGLAIVSEETF